MIKDLVLAVDQKCMTYILEFQDTRDEQPTQLSIKLPLKAQLIGRNDIEQMLRQMSNHKHAEPFYASLYGLHVHQQVEWTKESLKLIITRLTNDNFEVVKLLKKEGMI